jgi:hypothetical protein
MALRCADYFSACVFSFAVIRLPYLISSIACVRFMEQPQLLIAPDAVEADMRALLHDRNCQFIDWAGWLRIDAEEKSRGAALKKPREKLTTVAEMLRVASC